MSDRGEAVETGANKRSGPNGDGIYHILNKEYRTGVKVPENAARAALVGCRQTEDDDQCYRWKLLQYRDTAEYRIYNEDLKWFAVRGHANPDSVHTGEKGDWWKIEPAPRDENYYLISHLHGGGYWGLEEGSDDTTIKLRKSRGDDANLWEFEPVPAITPTVPSMWNLRALDSFESNPASQNESRSATPIQNHPPESTAQPAHPESSLQSGKSVAPARGVKRAARVAWPELENALRTLQQSSDMFPPIKPAVDRLLACVDILEASNREEYDELVANLAIILTDIAKHLRESRSIQVSTCASSIISDIEQQIDSINLKKARPGTQRSPEARQDVNDLIGCCRRIEMLFRRLQNNVVLSVWSITNEKLANTRLESLKPAKDAHYDSVMATVVRRRQCTHKTRLVVLEDLRLWRKDPNGAKVYWMNGMAGTGKTTIASTLCSKLEATHQLAASFFCSRELPECREAKRIVPTISYQLARFSLPFQSALCEALGNDPDASTRSVSVQFEKLIKEPLLRAKEAIPDGVVVVIDALDECSDGVITQSFLDALYRYAGDLPIRFFVTCRPDQSFSEKLPSWNQASRTLFHLHDIEQSVVRADIEIYLRAELEELSLNHVQQLSERSGKLFIFAATVVRYVKPNGARGIWPERLETMLRAEWSPGSKAHDSIDTLYNTILSAALSRDEFEPADVETMKRVLYTVICAKEQMTVETLAGVLDISVDRLVRVVEPLRSVLHVSEGSRLVSTLHASFPDYILNQERSKEYFCDTGVHHHFLSLRCFDVMKKLLRFNICDLESSYVLDADVPDLPARIDSAVSSHLFYACGHWADHLCEAGEDEGLVAPLEDFLSNSVLFWLEVLNLKKRMAVGMAALAKVQKWLQERNAPSDVCRIAQDAYKFATIFGANVVCNSTPHIYVSVLALWNKQDPMWITYGTRAQGLVQPRSALGDNWAPQLLAEWNNDGEVWSIAVSLDGSRVVSSSENQFVVWDAYTGHKILSPLNGHTDIVLSVAISANGRTIASGSEDGTIYIWDAQTADIIVGPLEGDSGEVNSVAFSPDGALLASSSGLWDRTIRIWDTRTGQVLRRLKGHAGSVNSVAFSPDRDRVVSGSSDCTIRIWDAQTGRILMSPFEGHTNAVNSVAFSPDGARIASGSQDCTIRIWDAQNGNLLAGPLREIEGVTSVSFSLDGTRIVSGSLDCTIRIWDAHSGSALAGPFRTPYSAPRSVAFLFDGNRVISGTASGENVTEDHLICIWDVNARSQPDNEPDIRAASVELVALSPDRSSIGIASQDPSFHIWNLHTGAILASLEPNYGSITSLAFAPDGAHVALGIFGGGIRIGNAENGIWAEENGNMALRSLRSHTRGVTSLIFSPDGKSIAAGSEDCTILLLDVDTGDILSGPLKGHTESVRSVVFSPDGALIASGSDDCTVRIWDTRTRDVPRLLEGHPDPVSSVAFSPDGGHVSGSGGRTACVWDVQTGTLLVHSSIRDVGSVESVALSSDGRRVVSGSEDGTIRIWDAWTGHTLAGPFKAHKYDVLSVAFSPDGSRVVSCAEDDEIFVWELRDRDSDITNVTSSWTLDEDDGWIVGRNSARLLWLPPALRKLLEGKPVMVHDGGPFGLNPDVAAVGTRWATCFSG